MALDKEFLSASHIAYSLSVHAAPNSTRQSQDNPPPCTYITPDYYSLLSTGSTWWAPVTSPNSHNSNNNRDDINQRPFLFLQGDPSAGWCISFCRQRTEVLVSHHFSPSFLPSSALPKPTCHAFVPWVCPYKA